MQHAGSWFPDQARSLGLVHGEQAVLTSGLPAKSLNGIFKDIVTRNVPESMNHPDTQTDGVQQATNRRNTRGKDS